MSAGASIDVVDKNGNILIHQLFEYEFKQGMENIIETLPLLLAHHKKERMKKEIGWDVNVRGHKGMTPLLYASWMGWIEGVKQLIEEGADVQARSDDGSTAMHYAAQHNTCKERGGPELHPFSDPQGALEVIRELHRRGVDINSTNSEGSLLCSTVMNSLSHYSWNCMC